jgi:riboflavin transporter FmnP
LNSNPAIEKSKTLTPRSRELAAIGLYGALAIILSLISNLALKLAFIPPVNYLLFDLGEIPVLICFLTIGPRSGVYVAVIEWLALNLLPTSLPFIGPSFKFMSVLSTLVGLWVGWKLSKIYDLRLKFVLGSVVAALSRAALMTIPNAALLVFIFHLPAFTQILYYYLELTAIFNVLQIPFDLIPTYIVIRLPQVRHMLRKNGMTWFESRRINTIK